VSSKCNVIWRNTHTRTRDRNPNHYCKPGIWTWSVKLRFGWNLCCAIAHPKMISTVIKWCDLHTSCNLLLWPFKQFVFFNARNLSILSMDQCTTLIVYSYAWFLQYTCRFKYDAVICKIKIIYLATGNFHQCLFLYAFVYKIQRWLAISGKNYKWSMPYHVSK